MTTHDSIELDDATGAAEVFAGPGELRALCRALDWSATPLGPCETWPPALRTAAGLVLAAPTGMILLWGPELVQVYNDVYRQVMGAKHPAGLGQRNVECWPEAWDFTAPVYEAVMRRRESLSFTDQRLVLERNGAPEEAFFTLSYSPVPDDAGGVGGILVTVAETTQQVRARTQYELERERLLAASESAAARQAFLLALSDRLRPLAEPAAIQFEAARALGEHLAMSRVGYAEIDGDFSIVTRNYTQGVRGIEGRYRVADYSPALIEALRAGRTVVRDDVAGSADLTASERAAHAAIEIGATVDLPLVKGGRLVAVMFMHRRHAHAWRDDEVTLLGDVAQRTWDAVERARAEAALRASEERLQQALSIETVGVLFFRLDGRITDANAALARMSGYDVDELRELTDWGDLTPPEFRDATARTAAELAATGRAAPYEKQWIRKDGSRFWGLFAPTRLAGSGPEATCVEFVIDITEAKRTEAALRASEARYRALFERMDEGFCVIEVLFEGERPVDYRFLEMNPAFVEHSGLAGALGRTARELVPAHETRWFETYGRVAVTGEHVRFTDRAEALGRWFDVYAFRIGERDDRRVAVLFRDITDRVERDTERERLLTQAEAASRAKSEFLAVMSHELRTPLNAIGGYTELIELGIHGPVTEAQREALGRIQASQRHLLGLINQVLNYARVDAGAVQYELVDVPVADAIAAAETLVLPQVRAHGLRYGFGGCDPTLAVRADRDKLQQVLLNLLSNAIKFTDAGGEIRVACEARRDLVEISVTDSGIGIAADKLDSVFSPFVQVDQRLTRPHEGVGLGLAISRDLARGMGGDLTVESAVGRGSVFRLALRRT